MGKGVTYGGRYEVGLSGAYGKPCLLTNCGRHANLLAISTLSEPAPRFSEILPAMVQKALFRVALVATAAVASPLTPQAEEAPTPLRGGYTIAFPEKPQEKEVTPSSNARTTVYSVNHRDAAFLSGYTEYGKNVDLQVELQADIDAFVKSIGAELTGQKRTDLVTASSGRMPRVDFTFESDKIAGRGIAIVTTPRSVIMVSALSVKPNGLQQVDRFVDSFQISE